MAKNLAKLLPQLSTDEQAWVQLFASWSKNERAGNFYKARDNLDRCNFILCDAQKVYEKFQKHWGMWEYEWQQLADAGRDHAKAMITLRTKLREYVKESSETTSTAR